MKSPKRRILSFKYAIEGIYTAFREEPNLKIHFLLGYLTLILGYFLEISTVEWLIIIIMVGLVIAVELTNTALEAVVDSFTSEQHPGAKKAKDVSSGAVLIISLTALAVGLIIFLPHLFSL